MQFFLLFRHSEEHTASVRRVAVFFIRWMLNLCGGRKCRPCKKVRCRLANHSYWSREEWIELVHKQWKLRMKASDFSETSGQTVCKFRIWPIFPHFLRCYAVVGHWNRPRPFPSALFSNITLFSHFNNRSCLNQASRGNDLSSTSWTAAPGAISGICFSHVRIVWYSDLKISASSFVRPHL
jgi:hypothetical protein